MKKTRKPTKTQKTSKRKINLRLAMIVGSVILLAAVLAYGTLQKTFFAPKAAAPNKVLTKAMYDKLYQVTKDDCFKKYQYTYASLSIAGDQGRCPSHTFEAGKVWNKNPLTDWKWYGNVADLKLFSNKYVRCCVDMKGYIGESDQLCSQSDMYDANGKYLGKFDMRCKPNCAYSSITDQDNEYKNGSYYFIRTGEDSIKQTIKSVCGTAEMKYGKYKKVLGTCCGK